MSGTFDIVIGGQASADLASDMIALEVEESADLPGAFRLTLPIKRGSGGDLDILGDSRLGPWSNIAVIAKAGDGPVQCIFDGYVLSQKVHLDTGTVASLLKVSGQDATWLMNVEEKTREWSDVTDGTVANSIFGDYDFAPDDGNLDDDSPAHAEHPHSLIQRSSDAQFLQMLARRSGKLCRVFCTDTPGVRTGYFGKPKLDGDPGVVLTLNDAESATVGELEFDWDVMRPNAVLARQALFDDDTPEGVGGSNTDTGLTPLGDLDLPTFAGKTVTSLLTTVVDDGGELTLRAQAVLRDASWFVRCQGKADASRLGAILRVGAIVRLDAAGAVHSGNYLVWNVRHTLTAERHMMDFTLVRNAVGTPAPTGGLGGLGL